MNKHVVKSISQCTDAPYTAERLESWSNAMKVIGYILIFFAFLVGLIVASNTANITVNTGWHTKTEFDGTVFGTVLGTYLGVGVAGLLTCLLTSVILSALADIVYNTSVSANVALYLASQKEPSKETTASVPVSSYPKATVNNGKWTCTTCGRVNDNANRTCKDCGNYK